MPRSAPSAVRNRSVILEVLLERLEGNERVLEIGSGTGEHAVFFAAAMPHLTWQTSDLANNHEGIQHWIDESGLHNVRPPMLLDTRQDVHWPDMTDVIYAANTAHIMSEIAVSGLFRLAGRALYPGGRLMLYGPFKVDGEFTSGSNAAFDASLRAGDPEMGIRDIEWMDKNAAGASLQRSAWFAMPANNFIVEWTKE